MSGKLVCDLPAKLIPYREPVITNWHLEGHRAASWTAGSILTREGHLVLARRTWLSYKATRLRTIWDQWRRHGPPGTCELFFHKSRQQPEFLVLGYVKSERRATLSSLYCATLLLDEVARLQAAHAIVADVSNARLSDRLLLRWGWQPHCTHWRGRHFIKRFYGTYPDIPPQWAERFQSTALA